MPRGRRCSHKGPCSCEMGNLYRFVEPIVLVCLAILKTAHGYQIAQEAEKLAVTKAPLDVAAIYRTLRRFEEMGFVNSNWDTSTPGPARREYTLTDEGWQHLKDWDIVLVDVIDSLKTLQETCANVLNEKA